jgi:MFS family permease
MRALISLYLGIFSVMALSNAIVPDLPAYAAGTALQGQIYSAYFLGAFLLTLPAGILSDRWGQIHFVRAGLLLTIVSGVLLLSVSTVYVTLFARLIEGVGAGLFISSAMSYVNSVPDHTRNSGIFMALLNAGLIAGLIVSGLVIGATGYIAAGVMIFLLLSVIPFMVSIFVPFEERIPDSPGSPENTVIDSLFWNIRKYFWMWLSSLVLIGITGAITVLHPQFSGNSPEIVGLQIAAMNGATAIAVLMVSHVKFAPVPTIRIAAIFSAAAVLAGYVTSWAFIAIGALSGIIIIAQLAFLADAGKEQGTFMGLFNTSSYLGMTLLPFIATMIAENLGFLAAYITAAILSLVVAATIGMCDKCRVDKKSLCNG